MGFDAGCIVWISVKQCDCFAKTSLMCAGTLTVLNSPKDSFVSLLLAWMVDRERKVMS